METLDQEATRLLAAFFPPLQAGQGALPAQFDDRCNKCRQPMERIRVLLRTQLRPYAQFHCTPCERDLYIFEAPRKPFLIWSDEARGIVRFSDFIKELIAKREEEHERDLLREQTTAA